MLRRRIWVLVLLVGTAMTAVLLRLASLQLVPATQAHYAVLSERRSSSFLPPLRGRILARDGSILAANETVFDLHFSYSGLQPSSRLLRRVAAALAKVYPEWTAAMLEERMAHAANEAQATTAGVPEWLPIVRDVLPVAWKDFSRAIAIRSGVFELRAGSHPETRDLWFSPSRGIEMSSTLGRLGALLAPSRGESPAACASRLQSRVSSVLESMETAITKELRRDLAAGVDDAVIEKKRQYLRNTYHDERRPLERDVPLAVVAAVEYHPERFAGIYVVDRQRRVYPLGQACGTLLGHLRQLRASEVETYSESERLLDRLLGSITFAELRERRGSLFALNDQVGATGLEASYDRKLRGAYGMVVARVDWLGRSRTELRRLAPIAGEDVFTTIDPSLQRKLYAELDSRIAPGAASRTGSAGSVVVMDLQTGGLLAAVGFPGVDSNRMRERGYAGPKADGSPGELAAR